jgi:hypothetical protein
LVAVAYFLPGRAKELSAPPRIWRGWWSEFKGFLLEAGRGTVPLLDHRGATVPLLDHRGATVPLLDRRGGTVPLLDHRN